MGLSGLGCLTEADFLLINASVYMGINRGGYVKVEADLVSASVNRKSPPLLMLGINKALILCARLRGLF